MFFLVIPVLLYFILICWLSGYLKNTRPATSQIESDLKVSVILSCRNEEKNLPAILKEISLQDYNPELFELIIVDDNSEDKTFEIASGYKDIRNLVVLRNPGQGKKFAIAFAVSNSTGELIITTDADCRSGRRWISSHVSHYLANHSDMIIGPVRLTEKQGFIGRFQELEFLSLQGITKSTVLAGKPVMCNGANLSFKKEPYLRHSVNLHPDLSSGDDVFLLHSLKKESDSLITWLDDPAGVVTTGQSEGWLSFLRQRARWTSKVSSYNDLFSITLASLSLATAASLFCSIIGGFFSVGLLYLYLILLLVKSVPDYLILRKITKHYNREDLLKWFLPSAIIYPFYVIVTAGYSMFMRRKW
jgi:poly-beta-1,6-N-acetyl-D-glucosamine synthase